MFLIKFADNISKLKQGFNYWWYASQLPVRDYELYAVELEDEINALIIDLTNLFFLHL